MRYYYQKPDIDIFTISGDSKEKILDNFGVGKIPSQIYFLVQETSRFEGNLRKNSLRFPRIFQNAERASALDSVKLEVGQQQIDGLEMTDTEPLYSLPYFKYFALNNALCGGANLPPDISPEEFLDDFHFYL